MKPGERSQREDAGNDRPGAEEPEAGRRRPAEQGQPRDKASPAQESSDDNGGTNKRQGRRESRSTERQARRPAAEIAADEDRRTTTGQGAAAGRAKLSSEQRTKITTIFHQHKVAPAHLNVSVSVGTRVPDSVHFYPLPVGSRT